jgi:hypothetical protein
MRHCSRQSGKARSICAGEDWSPLSTIEILNGFQIWQKLLPRNQRCPSRSLDKQTFV